LPTPLHPLHRCRRLRQRTLAADTDNGDSDNTGLWGLAGLLGLIGLVGLKRRNDRDVTTAAATQRPEHPARLTNETASAPGREQRTGGGSHNRSNTHFGVVE
jgi:LPXTG-motif cell wall-anchored protein